VLFADIRGYTTTSELLDLPHLARLLGSFYEKCASPIWEHYGIVNKLIGDAMLAIFNFPISQADHPRRAVEAALELQRRCRDMKSSLPEAERARCPIQVGVGLHCGEVSIGELGEFCKDFTAIGGVVNLASRLQGAAKGGEVLVTEEVYAHVRDAHPDAEQRTCTLKGIDRPVTARVLIPSGDAAR
jgi:adenylate cyclase